MLGTNLASEGGEGLAQFAQTSWAAPSLEMSEARLESVPAHVGVEQDEH